MTFGPGRSGVVLFNWNTWKSLHCVCGSVALLSCVMGQFICVWQGQCLASKVAPASAKVEWFSGETTEMSRATGLPRFQFCNRISAGRDCEWSGKSPAPTSIWTEACAR